MMQPTRKRFRNGTLSLATVIAVSALASCSAPPGSGGAPTGVAIASADSGGGPRVPFDQQPCRSLSLDEQKNLGMGAPVAGKSGRGPDDLAYDNTCEYSDQSLEYDTLQRCAEQKRTLHSRDRNAPTDIPGAFYDVLGNLWFVKNGYCVAIANNASAATRENMARVIAAKL